MHAVNLFAALFAVSVAAQPQAEGVKIAQDALRARSGPVASNPSTWWRAAIKHDGKTPTAEDVTYQYYRTVVDYGADNTGVQNATAAFNFAIDAWNRTGKTVTTMPAYVYVPPGTYRIKAPIQMLVSTFLVGDPLNPPTLIADPALGTDPVIIGYDSHQGDGSSTKNFYMSIRNIIIDTTEIDKAKGAVAIDWSVSQACSMNNVHVKMPNSSNHTGITMDNGGSGVTLADSTFTGGAVGIRLQNQQYVFKGLSFNGCNVGIKIHSVYVATFQGITFANCNYGVDMSDTTAGTVSLVDSSISSCNAGVNAYVSGEGQGSLTIDNFHTDGTTVSVKSSNGTTLLKDSVPTGQTWVMGNVDSGNYQSGRLYPINRPSALQVNGKYLLQAAPQYEKYDISQVVSITGDTEFPVYGDNSHDDGPNINAVLKKHADSKIIFVPQGIYVTHETIYIPPGTRMIGEQLSIITGNGSVFANADDPKPIVKVGNTGEKGVAQISDILVEVSDILPGAILMQVNMAGAQPGDVGIWNNVLRVGGSKHSLVNTRCTNTDTSSCKAAFALLHVTSTASLYAENTWGWVADHSLEEGGTQNIAVGRGALIESTQGTWIVGASFEHCTLYQFSLNKASNVYMGLQHTEAPYWQGSNQPSLAPSPWTPNAAFGDPTFGNCADQGQTDNGQCYRAWGHHASGSSNVIIHGSAMWVFFNGMNDNMWQDASCEKYGWKCQFNMISINSAASTFMYSLGSKSTVNLVYDTTGNVSVAAEDSNKGGWGGVIAAYLRDSGVDIDTDSPNSSPSCGPQLGLVMALFLAAVVMVLPG